MNLYFDDLELTKIDESKTLLEIAKEHGIFISAPCFYNQRSHGCCNSCIVIANGEQVRACEIKPEDGMTIIYDRDDLIELRANNLAKYTMRKNIETSFANSSCGSNHSHYLHSGHCDGSCATGNCNCGSH